MKLRTTLKSTIMASALMMLGAGGALAQSAFATTGVDFSDNMRGNRKEVVAPGGKGWINGRRMTAGQKLTFMRGAQKLNNEPLVER